MLTVLRVLLLRWLAARTLGGVLAAVLAAALPLAVLLKIVGIPLVAVLALVGAPLWLVLGLLRLPIRIVLGAVSVVSGLVAAAFAIGVFAMKLVLVALVAWFVMRWSRRARTSRESGTRRPPVAESTI